MSKQRFKDTVAGTHPERHKAHPRSAQVYVATDDEAPAVDCSRLRGSKISRAVLANSNPEDIASVQRWEQKALAELECHSPKAAEKALKLLFDAAEYYDSIGLHQNALRATTSILQFSKKTDDLFIQRRTHSALSAYYCRICDFNTAFQHAESSYTISLRLNDPVSKLVTLINTAVILDSVGLSENAKNVANAASKIAPGSDNELVVYLHLMNASNALRFCRNSDDSELAEYFFHISLKNFKSDNRLFTESTKAYCDAFMAEHLMSIGSADIAVLNLEKSVSRVEKNRNPRIAAILYGSLAEGYSNLGDLQRLNDCETRLYKLLPVEARLRSEDEDIFKVLIRLARRKNDKKRQADLSKRFQKHLMISRHRYFFEAIARNYVNLCDHENELRAPVFQTPDWILPLKDDENQERHLVSSGTFEGDSGSQQYGVAEDWAIAAEFYTGGSWEHCFGVGELVRVIALECNRSTEEAREMGLAARLHDIGKIATVEEMFRRCGSVPLSHFGAICRHAEVGSALLANSSDGRLQMAERMAGAHHEWWNGGGLPTGLRGESIPFEARVCAVADMFLECCKPRSGIRWSTAMATEQLLSMAGVQLDPQLVKILTRIVRASETGKEVYAIKEEAMQNKLLRTKKKLFNKLELAE